MNGSLTHLFYELGMVCCLYLDSIRLGLSQTNRYTGVTDEHVAAVLESPPRGVNSGILDDAHAAVLSYTDAMTVDIRVPDEVISKLKQHFTEREIVEITSTVGAYNCVSRVLVALDVGERNAQTGPKEGQKE